MARSLVRARLGACLIVGLALCDAGPCLASPRQHQQTTANTQDTNGESETLSGNSGSTSEGHPAQSDPQEADTTIGKHLFGDFVNDQKAIWTSPFHVHLVDAEWLVPLGGAAAAMFATDTEVSKHLSNSPSRISRSNSLSNYGIASLAGAAGGMYLWGRFVHNDHMRETGFLAAEAAADSLADTYALKYAFRRERPLQDNYQGQFWHGGDSFPSEHSAAAWAIAGVIAHEYPGPLTSVLSYGLAAAVSGSRITAKQHFPSDVLIGSTLGWFVAQEVYRHHHDPTVGGGDWETYAETHESGPSRPSNNIGSPYVELDSWIYPAFERLIALGYVSSADLGSRPWTRRECVRLLEEAEDEQVYSDRLQSDNAEELIDALRKEFTPDTKAFEGKNRQFAIDSVYTRMLGIDGQPLTDGFHFGQTLINDYGRPFGEGPNNVTGASAWFSAGMLAGYIRGEYQYASSNPGLPFQARLDITSIDGLPGLPLPPGTPIPAISQFQLLDSYISMNFSDWQVSFGRQSLWWGPSDGGPMMFTDNAVPITMFRIDRTAPLPLPSILHVLGPLRAQLILGRLSGHDFVYGATTGLIGQWGKPLGDQPFIDGFRFTLQPTRSFEFGLDYTTVVGGPGVPFTFHKFIQSMFNTSNALPGTPEDPGDRRSGADFNYKFGSWLSLYGEAFNEDEFSPIRYAYKAAFQGGIYLPHIPHIRKLDIRVEGGSTSPVDYPTCNGCFYNNGRYYNSYTNDGYMLGSWIGRASQGEQAWATYWLTSRDKIQLNFRHRKIDSQFLPQGGTVNDASIRVDWLAHQYFDLSTFLQFEKWLIPVLSSTPQQNLTISIQLGFHPNILRDR